MNSPRKSSLSNQVDNTFARDLLVVAEITNVVAVFPAYMGTIGNTARRECLGCKNDSNCQGDARQERFDGAPRKIQHLQFQQLRKSGVRTVIAVTTCGVCPNVMDRMHPP